MTVQLGFTREENITKEAIADFQIVLFVPGPDNTEEVQSGQIEVQIKLSDGKIETEHYDLLARLQDDACWPDPFNQPGGPKRLH